MTTALDVLWRASLKLSRRGPREKRLPPLLFFTDPLRTPAPERTLAALPSGSAIVFRAFGAADAIASGGRLAQLARKRRVLLFVGADAALARALRADGVHLPERSAHRAGVVRRLRRRFIVTAAAHSLPAIRRARHAGVDAVVLSPVFPSASPSAGRPLGPLRFERLVRLAGTPVYGLGGVSAATVRRLAGSRAIGLAAVTGLESAVDPAAVRT
jgi:thiamine-phosphate pyrophosphorylase